MKKTGLFLLESFQKQNIIIPHQQEKIIEANHFDLSEMSITDQTDY